MKTINYTGSSKLISRIVNLLNRRAPLPLDGDGYPVWGTNGQVLSTDGNGNTAWVNQGGGGGGGGHTIWNRIKSALTQRGKLWFADASVSDVSADDATKVEVVTELLNETAFDNLATDGTADGIYTFPDSGGEYLTAAMSSYDNTVSGLSATDVQDAIDEVASKTIRYIDAPFSETSIASHGYLYLTAPDHTKDYIACKLVNTETSNNVFVTSEPLYRPSSPVKYTTIIYNPYTSALSVGGYVRWYYIG